MAKLKKAPVKKSTKKVAEKGIKKSVSSGFYVQIRSRHPSHNILRGSIKLPFRSVVRFGSTTELEDTEDNGGNRVQLNSVEAIKNSASKLRMKNCFTLKNVKTADWYYVRKNNFYHIKNHNNQIQEVVIAVENLPYPIVAKHHFGSRGNGNYLLNSQQELQSWMTGKDLSNYIFEKFYNYTREYRLHVSKNGCFYTCRKMLKSDIPKEDRWYRNDSNSVWVLEENPLFDKPINWKDVEKECVKALKATGLDFGACDVKIQSAKTEKGKKREELEFIIVEINSAPSFGDITAEEYMKEIPKLLTEKKNKK